VLFLPLPPESAAFNMVIRAVRHVSIGRGRDTQAAAGGRAAAGDPPRPGRQLGDD